MKSKVIAVSVLFAVSAALVGAFTVKTAMDWNYYTHSANSAPFSIFVAVNALCFIVPAVILAALALFLMKKTRALWIMCGVCAAAALAAVIVNVIKYGGLSGVEDGLIHSIPAVLSIIICGIFALISRKRLTKA